MPSDHGRQKKLAKQKKRRDSARKANASKPTLTLQERIIRLAATLPNGPTYISPGWDEEGDPPELITIVTTKLSPDGMIIPAIALVDRTCTGIKNGFVAEPVRTAGLKRFLEPIIEAHGGLAKIELEIALSIVHHAIDYARSLGFEPHPDFPAPLFGPRPEPLRDTVLSKPTRPFYAAGPDDDVASVVRRLERAVGANNFDFRLADSLDDDDDEA